MTDSYVKTIFTTNHAYLSFDTIPMKNAGINEKAPILLYVRYFKL